jgi:hypothetical protein
MSIPVHPKQVYFAYFPELDLVKIGESVNPLHRLEVLQGKKKSVGPFVVFAAFIGRNEKATHAEYSEYLHKGEWFRIPADVRKQITASAPEGWKSKLPKLRGHWISKEDRDSLQSMADAQGISIQELIRGLAYRNLTTVKRTQTNLNHA